MIGSRGPKLDSGSDIRSVVIFYLLFSERERMQVIDGLPKLGHSPGEKIDHLDVRGIRGEGSEFKPIVETIRRVEIAQCRHRGRIQDYGFRQIRFSRGRIETVGLLSGCTLPPTARSIDIPQEVVTVEREPILGRVDPGVGKLGRDAGFFVDLDERIVIWDCRGCPIKLVIPGGHTPIRVNRDGMDRRIIAGQTEIESRWIHRLTGSGLEVDRDQAMEGYVANRRRSIQLLGLAVPCQPVDRIAHRPDYPDQRTGIRIKLHQGARFRARAALKFVIARCRSCRKEWGWVFYQRTPSGCLPPGLQYQPQPLSLISIVLSLYFPHLVALVSS